MQLFGFLNLKESDFLSSVAAGAGPISGSFEGNFFARAPVDNWFLLNAFGEVANGTEALSAASISSSFTLMQAEEEHMRPGDDTL